MGLRMGRFRSIFRMFEKRGDINVNYLVTIVLCAMIFFGLMYLGIDYGSGILFSKVYASRDLALLTDAAYDAPGNLFTSYSSGKYDFRMLFKDNMVTVYDSNSLFSSQYNYADVVSHPLDVELNNPRYVYFAKVNKDLTIGSTSVVKDLYITCPDINPDLIPDLQNQKILLDPAVAPWSGTSSDDNSYNSEIAQPEAVMWKIADYVRSSLTTGGGATGQNALKSEPKITRALGGTANAQQSAQDIKDSDITIKIVLGYNPDVKAQEIRVAVPKIHNGVVQDSRFACILINSLLDKFPSKTITLAQPYVDDDELLAQAPDGKIAVKLIIGNVAAKQNNILDGNDNIAKIGAGITDAITKYHAISDKPAVQPAAQPDVQSNQNSNSAKT